MVLAEILSPSFPAIDVVVVVKSLSDFVVDPAAGSGLRAGAFMTRSVSFSPNINSLAGVVELLSSVDSVVAFSTSCLGL